MLLIKTTHTLWIYHLVKTIFKKNSEQITGYNIFEINKELLFYYIYIYIYRMGLSESALKPFSFFTTL